MSLQPLWELGTNDLWLPLSHGDMANREDVKSRSPDQQCIFFFSPAIFSSGVQRKKKGKEMKRNAKERKGKKNQKWKITAFRPIACANAESVGRTQLSALCRLPRFAMRCVALAEHQGPVRPPFGRRWWATMFYDIKSAQRKRNAYVGQHWHLLEVRWNFCTLFDFFFFS